jgi:hypothetical protein
MCPIALSTGEKRDTEGNIAIVLKEVLGVYRNILKSCFVAFPAEDHAVAL